MVIETLVVGPLQVNCYVIGDEDTKQAVVIDPGDEPDRILDAVRRIGLKVIAIVCTHAHFDHVGAVGDVKNETGARVLMHAGDAELYGGVKDQAAFWGYAVDDLPEPDAFLSDGEELKVGNLVFRVLHTPGHSPGGISLCVDRTVITGDTLFQGSVGRTDFQGGDITKLKESFRRLMQLPDETDVLSGHGPETTIGREKRYNLFAGE